MKKNYTENFILFENFIKELQSWYIDNTYPNFCDQTIIEELNKIRGNLKRNSLLEFIELNPISDIQMYMEKSNSKVSESVYYQKLFRKRSFYKYGHFIHRGYDYVTLVMTIQDHKITNVNCIKNVDFFNIDAFKKFNKFSIIVFIIIAILICIVSLIIGPEFDFFSAFFFGMLDFIFYLYSILLYFLLSFILLLVKGVYIGLKTLYCGGIRSNRVISFYKYNSNFTSYDFEKIIVSLTKKELLDSNPFILDICYNCFYKIINMIEKNKNLIITTKIYLKNTQIHSLGIHSQKQTYILKFSINLDLFKSSLLWKDELNSCTLLSLKKIGL